MKQYYFAADVPGLGIRDWGFDVRPLILPHDADDNTLYLYAVRLHHDRLHRGVCGLQPHAPVLAIELLQRDVGTAHQGNDHFAVVGGFAVFDDDEVTVTNLFVDHRVALDPKDVGIAFACERFGHGDGFVARDRFDRRAGGDKSEQRQLHGAAPTACRHELDRPAAVPGAPDKSLLLEVR